MANDKLKKINNEIKDYINESNFISIKARNKIIKMLGDEFDIKFRLDNYQTIDVTILENGHIIMYGDEYTPEKNIEGIKEIEERYTRFKERADKLLSRKEIDFKTKSNVNNVTNLVIVICIIGLMIGTFIIGIFALINGNYFDCLWFLIIASWIITPSLKQKVLDRFAQAKRYLKGLIKKVK